MRGRPVALVALLVAALTLGTASAADARPWHGWHHHHQWRPAASAPATPRPTVTAAPTSTPTPAPTAAPAPAGPTFREDFTTQAAAGGPFARQYAGSWQPYPDGLSGKYYPGALVSAHDGVMDITLDGKRGAAGTFGTPADAWSHVGGTFTIRAKATGGDGNGTSIMLWPTSDVWADGEVDYPEGNFDHRPHVYHHSMVKGQEGTSQQYDTGVSWNDWHTYSTVWIPGKAVRYYLDGALVFTVTSNVTTSPHRYMVQTGNYGSPGHLLIDWVSTDDRVAR